MKFAVSLLWCHFWTHVWGIVAILLLTVSVWLQIFIPIHSYNVVAILTWPMTCDSTESESEFLHFPQTAKCVWFVCSRLWRIVLRHTSYQNLPSQTLLRAEIVKTPVYDITESTTQPTILKWNSSFCDWSSSLLNCSPHLQKSRWRARFSS